jgi:CP family cyanate transporter-like MFS transporter
MSSSAQSQAKAGRVAAYLGIVLAAAGLLTGVTSFSPIAEQIATDIHLTPVTYGLLGTLSPIVFGVVGLVTPLVSRLLSLEWTILIAAALMALGQLFRAFAGEAIGFFGFSIVAMLGIGAANMLLPPLIKRFFPDRVVTVSTAYSVLLVASSVYPPLFAVPLAQAIGWRGSVGVWCLVEFVAILPWLAVIVGKRKNSDAIPDAQPPAGLTAAVWKHRASWSLMAGYAVGVFNFYIVVAWLPTILMETAKVDAATAGILLSVYSGLGIVTGFIVPRLLHAMENIGLIFVGIVAFTAIGYLGLLLAPMSVTWLWVLLAGVGPTLFTTVLVGLNYRSHTPAGAVALGGMVTAGGYIIGAAGPLIVGALRAQNVTWAVTWWMLILSLIVAVVAGLGLRRHVNVDA